MSMTGGINDASQKAQAAMSDTLRERLRDIADTLQTHNANVSASYVYDAIVELDRLEAEVKKPRLPEGVVVFSLGDQEYGDIIVISRKGHPEDDFLIDPTHALYKLFSAFLPTPDVVPSTEPVQAAEKPKPVSLKFTIPQQSVSVRGIIRDTAGNVVEEREFVLSLEQAEDLFHTLDQERGV